MAKAKVDKSLDDTGERMIPAYHKTHMVYGEHIVRYMSVLDIVKDKNVLDVASGSGYGTALLASTAKKVTGVDIDKDAVRYAKNNYGNQNIEFVLGSGTDIPLKDSQFDVVVSYETIEHIEEYETFLSEVRRVLKPDGLFILSTPNDIEFPESNHFHVHEFTQTELEGVVGKYFSNTKTYFQATWLYNAILDTKGLKGEWDEYVRTVQTAPIDTDKAIYFQLLCSNRKVDEKIAPISAISEHWSERRKQEDDSAIRDHIEEQGRIIRHLEDKLNAQENANNELSQELNKLTGKPLSRIVRRAKRLGKKK